MTKTTERKIPSVYSFLSNNKKNQRPGPYNCLCCTDDRKYFSDLSNTKSKRSPHDPLGEESERNMEMLFLRKR